MDQPRVDILVVDDDPNNLVAIEAILNELGQNVVKASSGNEALRRLLTQEFALIILDVRMPDMDGYETARLIRERDKTRATPIIFLTAFDRSESEVMRAYELGAVDFLHKPIVPTTLKSKAAVFVELFRKTIEVKRQGDVLREIEKKEHERALLIARQSWEAEKLRAEMEQSKRAADVIAAKAAELAHTISERERAEEALKQSNQRLRLLSETATRLLHWTRPQDFVTSLFDRIASHLGLEVELGFTVMNGDGLVLDSWAGIDEEVARSRAGQVLAEVCERVARERRRLIAESLAVGDRYPAMRSLGVEAFVCYPLLAHGRLMGTLVFGTRRRPVLEIDELAVLQVFCDQVAMAMERARLLAELERRNNELAEADRRKDEFLAMLGHELRNPLAPMVNALQLMRLRGDEDDTVVRAHRAMDRQLRHLVRLVDDLLDVSRITQRQDRAPQASGPSCGRSSSTALADQPAARRRARASRSHLDAPDEPIQVVGRRDPPGAGGVEPPQQRRQVHAAGREHLARRRASTGTTWSSASATTASASRPRCCRGSSSSSCRPHATPSDRAAGRARHRPDAGQAPGRAARRRGARLQRGSGQWLRVRGHAARHRRRRGAASPSSRPGRSSARSERHAVVAADAEPARASSSSTTTTTFARR